MTAAMTLPAAAIVKVHHQNGLLAFGPRQCLHRHVGHGRKRTPGAGEKLAEVVAGDVLHNAAAGFEGLAAPGNGTEAEKMIARGAGLYPPRPGEVSSECTADRARVRRTSEKRPVIHRLEGQPLAACGGQRFHLGERRAGLRRQHQLLRLVERDAGQGRKVERRVPLRRPADRALAAPPDDFERLAARERPADRLLDVRRIARFEIRRSCASQAVPPLHSLSFRSAEGTPVAIGSEASKSQGSPEQRASPDPLLRSDRLSRRGELG